MAKRGYWVVSYRSVSSPEVFSEYAKLAAVAVEQLGGHAMVVGKPAKTYEAGVDQMVVIVEFESLDSAIAAYESDQYRPALTLISRAAERDFRILEGR